MSAITVAPATTNGKLLAAALALFAERGYHGTSIRDIAGQVGVQISTLYHHFGSKQQLLFELMTRTMADLSAEVEVALASGDATPERLRAAIRAHIRFHGERRTEAFVADSELRALEPENRKVIVRRRDAYEQLFERVLREGHDAGVVHVPDARLATLALMSMCVGVAAWFRPDGRLTLDEVADAYADLFLGAITQHAEADTRRQPARVSRRGARDASVRRRSGP